MSDPNNLEGPPPTVEERAAMARELDALAPTPGDKFALMFGQRPTPRTDAEKRHAFISDHTRGYRPAGLVVRIDLARQLERELAEARAEGEEQARLLGMSGEREAGLLAEIDRLKRELAETVACMRLAEAATIRALNERNEARGQRDRLAKAGKALVDRWETPFWKDVPHTGKFIRTLSDALAALKGGAE
jgi:hypothetical protein